MGLFPWLPFPPLSLCLPYAAVSISPTSPVPIRSARGAPSPRPLTNTLPALPLVPKPFQIVLTVSGPYFPSSHPVMLLVL